MFDVILHPIQTARQLRYIYSNLDSDYIAELEAAKTEDEKSAIRDRKTKELFPEVA